MTKIKPFQVHELVNESIDAGATVEVVVEVSEVTEATVAVVQDSVADFSVAVEVSFDGGLTWLAYIAASAVAVGSAVTAPISFNESGTQRVSNMYKLKLNHSGVAAATGRMYIYGWK